MALALPFAQPTGLIKKREEEVLPNIVLYYRDDKDPEAKEKRAEEVNPNLTVYYRGHLSRMKVAFLSAVAIAFAGVVVAAPIASEPRSLKIIERVEATNPNAILYDRDAKTFADTKKRECMGC
ncbi:hypothetical protein DL93DRAFT_2168253 [Clavulina sp. PMI_390]|nr:hypothetical protein DL93DRAFT_2168253 [Clavulina sp. PMI_390]